MVGLVESLAQQLVHRTTDPFGLAILTGVASSSFWFFGTFVLSLDGTLPATITELERAKKGISNTSALKLWEWMFYRGMIRFATAGIMSGTSYFVASIFRPDLRPILYGASLLSFSITPYSLVILMPANKALLKVVSDISKPDAKTPESGLVDKLFNDWRKYHSVRIWISGVVWALGTAALLLA